MKNLIIAAFATLFVATAAFADDGCAAKAVSKDGKPLAGAAKNAFIKKCEKDAAAAAQANSPCAMKAAEKKLHGAAKNSFLKKCEKDTAAAK